MIASSNKIGLSFNGLSVKVLIECGVLFFKEILNKCSTTIYKCHNTLLHQKSVAGILRLSNAV